MVDSLRELNTAQREAVTATEGFIRVIAGAGSGKTRALTHRFAYLVNELGILPGNILCVTFTNKSANEMRQRIHALTGDNDTGYINTFHGFCVSILQEDSHAVQYPKSFLVLDNSDIDAMLQIIYEERGLTLRDMTFSAARYYIIADGKLLVHPVKNALVKAFVMAAHKNQVLTGMGVIFNNALLQRSAAGAQGNYACVRQFFLRFADSRYKRFRLKHHSGAAAKGRIVNRAVLIMRKIARVYAADA